MDLYHHQNPLFTKWIVHNRLLHEPYVVFDIGCQGGAHPRWAFLCEFLDWYGFDPIAEVINELVQQPPSSVGRHTYQNLALGNEDGHRRFWVKPVRSTPIMLTWMSAPRGMSRSVGSMVSMPRDVFLVEII